MSGLIERILERLPNAKRTDSGWTAGCPGPLHHRGDRRPSLGIAEGDDGRALLNCFVGCTTESIVVALGLTMADLFSRNGHREDAAGPRPASPLTLQDLAADKGLPADFLHGLGLHGLPGARGVGIPYKNADGTTARIKRRTALVAKEGSFWPKGAPLVVYGQERLGEARTQGFLVLGEGESDGWTCWYHGFPYLGIPGAGAARTLQADHLMGIDRLYVIEESDGAGPALVHGVARRLRELSWQGQAFVVRLPDAKDPNELHKRDPNGFESAFGAALAAAGPLSAEPQPAAEAPAELAWRPSLLLSNGERQRAARGTFVDDYASYAAKRTDAPREFPEALALAVLSVVVGRRAVLRLSTGNVYPSIWILILADSTLYRKSTAMDFGQELVELVDGDLLAPNDFTPQRFVAILAEHDGRPLLFKRDEFSGFYDGLNRLDYMAGLKEVLCDVYDGRPFKREKMKPKKSTGEAAKDEEWRYDIRQPFLSLAVATTEERFFEIARVNDVHSGFLPRFAFVLPPGRPGERRPLREMDGALERERERLSERLRELADTSINLSCEPEIFARFDRYLVDLEADARAAPDSNLVAIVGSRISWMAWRVAMILAVADGTQRMAVPHLLRGIEMAEGWRHAALRVLGAPRAVQVREARRAPGAARRAQGRPQPSGCDAGAQDQQARDGRFAGHARGAGRDQSGKPAGHGRDERVVRPAGVTGVTGVTVVTGCFFAEWDRGAGKTPA